MLLRVLGPVELHGEPLGGGKQLTTLAVLVLSANEWVSCERLIDAIWADDPPKSAAGNVSTYIWGLSRLLPDRIERHQGRYRLRVEADELDLSAFRALVVAGRHAEAVTFWRGDPFEGISSEVVRNAAVLLLEEKHAAEDELTGDVTRLRELVAAQPLRERRWAHLMQALHDAGRLGEALEAYQRFYRLLDTELGVEPGAEIRRLHQRLLAPDVPVPAQLPAAVAGFVGREAELKRLDDLALGGTVMIVTVTGTAGVGKTALALQWAHRRLEPFPDGQLYVNLQGYSAREPVEPDEALELMLRGLGAEKIPPSTEARANLYRSLVAGKKMLVVLDNAGAADQVRPLVPGSPGSVVLVTSRDTLDGLVALDGARRIRLDVLPEHDAVDLVRDLADVDEVAGARLVAACARLPLALRIAAANLDAGVDEYLAALGDDVLTSHFDHSYARLGEVERRAFRLLGLMPGADIAVPAAAALFGCTEEEAATLLRRLVKVHLVEQQLPGRYTFHDLLRAYAIGLGGDDEALTRLYDWYLDQAATAALAWFDLELPALAQATRTAATKGMPHAWRIPAETWRYLRARGREAAWLDVFEIAHSVAPDVETALLVARSMIRAHRVPDAVRLLEQLQPVEPGDQVQVIGTLGIAHNLLDDPATALALHQQAHEIAARTGDATGEAKALLNIAMMLARLDRHEEAIERYEQALTFDLDEPSFLAQAHNNFGVLLRTVGRAEEALRQFHLALELVRALGNRWGEANTMSNIGDVHGRGAEGLAWQRKALAIARDIGDTRLEELILTSVPSEERRPCG
ncbi:AfsR/SARP family transcriptional regulator [Lentzea aerocolonigenes]|uniref:AfsR/SARP family transcriptional regulator n=1 Tax=Lentzea aerocolonigenes TaxID=68170 RepID=UPI000697F309|nr:tetratricopeptide repeat protein [Lentzea aerocolonigenes]